MKGFVPCALISALLLSGCAAGGVSASHRDLEQMRLVQTLGMDRDASGGVTLSAVCSAPRAEGKPMLLRGGGTGILDAMDTLQAHAVEGELFFGHVNYLLIGRAAAEAGLGTLLDFLERDDRMRLGTELFILREGTAADLVMGAGGESYDVTKVLSSVRQDVEDGGIGHTPTARETAVALEEYGAALVCLLRSVTTEGNVQPEENGRSAAPDGYAVLKDGALAGVLEDGPAEAAGVLLGYPGVGIRSVPDGQGGSVTLRFYGSGSAEAVWSESGEPTVSLRLRVRAAAAEAENDAACTETSVRALEQSLAGDLRRAVELSRTLDADFLALGKTLRQSGGARYGALPADWLRGLDCSVSVEAVANHSFNLNDAAKEGRDL